MDYRREIDGLRALAVVAVILFHAGFATFAGGFVGVDVFFVISGYLITTLVLKTHQDGRFHCGAFWARRARRLLPALFAMLLACLPLAWLTLTPAAMQSFSQSLVAVVGLAANIFFWRTGNGYFGVGATQPLLHTWSLAVEEQFYLFLPLLFGLAWTLGQGRGAGPGHAQERGRRWLAGLLGLLGAGSLGLSVWGTVVHPLAAFFLLPTRAWEFVAGALIPLLGGARGARPRPWPVPPGLAAAGAWSGLGLILFAVFSFDGETPFPGWTALAPVAGTVLILLCTGPGNPLGRGLALAPLVGLGRISYSAYLWHLPLFAFAQQWGLKNTPLPPAGQGLLLVLVWPLAYASWRWVEQPFRRRGAATPEPSSPSPSPSSPVPISVPRPFVRGWPLWSGAVVASGLLLAFGLVGLRTQGTFFRPAYVARGLPLQARLGFNAGLAPDCVHYFPETPACRTGERPEILLWGDSEAMHLADGIRASHPGVAMVQFAGFMCGPLLGVAPIQPHWGAAWSLGCIADNERVMAYLRRHPETRYVVMSSLMGQYVNPGARVMTADGRIVDADPAARTAFAGTLATLRAMGRVPVVFMPTPRGGFDTGRCLVRAGIAGLPGSACDFPLAGARAEQDSIRAWLAGPGVGDGGGNGVRVVSLAEGLCPHGVCRAAIGDTPIYVDGVHLSHAGSRWLGRRMDFYGLITGTKPAPVPLQPERGTP